MIKPITLLLFTACFASGAFAKSDPKEYVQGKVIEIFHDNGTSGLVNDMHRDSGRRYTYVIEGNDGRYEAREYQTDRLFKPLDLTAGANVQFRVHPKGRILYVAVDRGERPLEVLKFTPR